jgi:uncharacterized protein (DUF983 family)
VPKPSTLAAIARQRCPVCRQGRVFAGQFEMHPTCPQCGSKFEGAPGYFNGAMFVSYVLATMLMVVFAVLVYLFSPLELQWCALVGIGLFLPFLPAVFRYSRVIWMYVDRWLDPS